MRLFLLPGRQFILPHSRGSSHGQTRITRKAYDHDFYTRMMKDNYELWAQLERESGVKLFRWALRSKNPIRWKVAKTLSNTVIWTQCVYVEKKKGGKSLQLNLQEPQMHDFAHYLWLASLRRPLCLW